jgi:uncharacterized protein (TIGR00297 family)
MAGFAALLRYITWPQAAALAVAALAFNVFVLPRVAPGILRVSDSGGHRAGVIFYPLSVLILVLVFRSRLDIVAAAWAVMAFGDGAATLAGTRIGGPRLPWNTDKTWSGLLGFMIASSIGAVMLSVWVAPAIEPPVPSTFTWWAPVAASVVAAFVETIPVKLDDNLSVPVAAGLVLLLAALVNQRAVELAWPALASRLPIAIGLNLVMATAAWMRGSVTWSGALAGALIGAIVYTGAGLPGWAMLLTAFVAAVGASKLGRRRQIARGIVEDKGDRRGAGNVLANCLVGAIGAWMMTVETADAPGALILAAGLAAGASDTVASEIGKAFGGSPRAFPTFRHVPPGTPGAVSLIGTAAGFVAALLMAMLAVAILPGGEMLLPGVVVGATIGAFVESSLATRFEPEGVLNNDLLNFINTAVAAVVAVATTAVAAVIAVAATAGALQLLDRV